VPSFYNHDVFFQALNNFFLMFNFGSGPRDFYLVLKIDISAEIIKFADLGISILVGFLASASNTNSHLGLRIDIGLEVAVSTLRLSLNRDTVDVCLLIHLFHETVHKAGTTW